MPTACKYAVFPFALIWTFNYGSYESAIVFPASYMAVDNCGSETDQCVRPAAWGAEAESDAETPHWGSSKSTAATAAAKLVHV